MRGNAIVVIVAWLGASAPAHGQPARVAADCGQGCGESPPAPEPVSAGTFIDRRPAGTLEVAAETVVHHLGTPGLEQNIVVVGTGLRTRYWWGKAWVGATLPVVVLAEHTDMPYGFYTAEKYWNTGVGYGRLELGGHVGPLGAEVAVPVPVASARSRVGELYPAFSASVYGGTELTANLGWFLAATLDVPGNFDPGEYGNDWQTGRLGSSAGLRWRNDRVALAAALELSRLLDSDDARVAGARLQAGVRLGGGWSLRAAVQTETTFGNPNPRYQWHGRTWAMLGVGYSM